MNGLEVDSIAPIPIYEGQVITIPTIEGIAGWSTTSNGSIEYSAGDTITVTSDTTLYAANYTASITRFPSWRKRTSSPPLQIEYTSWKPKPT